MSLIKSIKAQLGLSTTPANNFTLDASADNGTMKLARGNAGATTQDVMTVNAAGKVTFPQNAQTWQDVTASRAVATPYTNTTDQPIQVSISCNLGASAGVVSFGIGAVVVSSVGFAAAGNVALITNAVIPVGVSYRLDGSGGTPSNIKWLELRN